MAGNKWSVCFFGNCIHILGHLNAKNQVESKKGEMAGIAVPLNRLNWYGQIGSIPIFDIRNLHLVMVAGPIFQFNELKEYCQTARQQKTCP